MKKSIVLISLLIAKTSLANVSALKCSITGDLVDSKLQVKKYVLPADTGVRKVSYLLSEETKDKMATYNTTVNLYLKTDVNGIQSVEVSAWPQGGARVSSLNRKKLIISTPSRISDTVLKNELICNDEVSEHYFLVSKFTFKDEEYLNVSGVTTSSFIDLGQMKDEISYSFAMSNAKSLSEFTASEFCYIGSGITLLNDLKSSVTSQLNADLQQIPSPLFWERSSFSLKTLSPLNLALNQDGIITWTQLRESKVCSKSHTEIIYNNDIGIDESVEVCDEYAFVVEPSRANILNKCTLQNRDLISYL